MIKYFNDCQAPNFEGISYIVFNLKKYITHFVFSQIFSLYRTSFTDLNVVQPC